MGGVQGWLGWGGSSVGSTTQANQAVATSARAGSDVFRGHILEFDGIRGLATTVVVLAHLWHSSLSVKVGQVLTLAWGLMDWFFVLSGFLITGILLDTRGRPDYFRRFYFRRALRILPLYYVFLALFTASVYLADGGLVTGYALRPRTVTEWGSPWWFFAYVGNIPTALIGDWPFIGQSSEHRAYGIGSAFGPLWSLQIEEQFYLFLPLLVALVRPETLRGVLLAMIPFSLGLRVLLYVLYPDNELVQYVLLPCRLDGFAMGGLIALRFRQGSWNLSKTHLSGLTAVAIAAAIAVAVYGGLVHQSAINRTIGFSVTSLASALVILWAIAFRGHTATSWLRLRPVQYLGKISYGMYLLHVPAIGLVGLACSAWGITLKNGGYGLRLLIVPPLVFAAASLSWRYLEEPFLKLKRRERVPAQGQLEQPRSASELLTADR